MQSDEIKNYKNHKTWKAIFVICLILNIGFINKLSPFGFAIISVFFLAMAYGQHQCIKDIEKLFEADGMSKSEYPQADYQKIVIICFLLMMLASWASFNL
jgi:hypothetical protein